MRTSRFVPTALLLAAAPVVGQEPAADAGTPVELVAVKGPYADLPEQTLDLASALQGPARVLGFFDLIDRLTELGAGDAPGEILFDLSQPTTLNLPQVAELSRAIGRLRAAGKHCTAYLEGAGRVQYALASQCDQILLADMGALDVGALSLSTLFMRDALDLLGVQFDVVRCGDFKGAVEPYTLSQMSPHLRQHYLAMLETMNDDLVQRIAKGRQLEPARVRDLQRQRLFSADQALAAKLVDRLVPWQGAKRALGEVVAGKIDWRDGRRGKKSTSFNPFGILAELFQPPREKRLENASVVVLHLSGAIADGAVAQPGTIVSGPMVAAIRELAADDEVRGVVVRINSPGGSATASEAILLALRELAERKPVVCSMGSLAASGGYYVTCFGVPILAEATTITGSIGVFGMKPNLGPLMRRVGLHQELVALDSSASLDAVDQPWSDADKQTMQHLIDQVYGRFLDHVAASRGVAREAIEKIAGGRVWSGAQALQNHLVDGLGGLDEALAMVAEQAKLERGKYDVVHRPHPRTVFDAFAETWLDAQLRAPRVAEAVAAGHGRVLAQAASVLRAVWASPSPGQVWALIPDLIDLR